MRRRTICAAFTAAGLASSFSMQAQGLRPRRIGYLGSLPPNAAEPRALLDAFLSEMRRRGWLEGKNVVYDFHFANGRPKQYEVFARQLVEAKVDVIAAMTTSAASAVKAITSEIPVVFLAADPVEYGLIKSLHRPGGNLTGMSLALDSLLGKRMQLLTQAVHGIASIAYLGHDERRTVDVVKAAAQALGRDLVAIDAAPDQKLDLERAIGKGQRADAWLVDEYPDFSPNRAKIIQLIAAQRKPAMFSELSWAREGGLLAYSEDRVVLFSRVAAYVDRILRGAKPAELPVEEPTSFLLTVNLRTARSLGITVQKSLLLQANEVIE